MLFGALFRAVTILYSLFFLCLFRVGFVLYFFRDLLLRPRVTFRRQRLLSSLLAARWYALVLWSLVTRKTPRTKFVGKKGLDPKTRGTRFSPLRPRQKTTTTTTTKPSAPLSLPDLLHSTQRLSSNGAGEARLVCRGSECDSAFDLIFMIFNAKLVCRSCASRTSVESPKEGRAVAWFAGVK